MYLDYSKKALIKWTASYIKKGTCQNYSSCNVLYIEPLELSR